MLTFLLSILLLLYMTEDLNTKQIFISLSVVLWFLMPLILFLVGRKNDWWYSNRGTGWFVLWIYLLFPILFLTQKLNEDQDKVDEEEKLYNEVIDE